jgi:MFS family permease
MVLVGGIIVDRVGTRLATFVFAVVCMLGALLTAASPDFHVMALGRLVFGLGAESMIVAIQVAIGQWFVGRQLGFAFGVNLSIARAGSYAAGMSTTWAKPAYDAGWQPPLWVAAGIMLVGVAAAGLYSLLERSSARQYDLGQPPPPDRIVWGDLWRFDRSYWYIVGLCVTFYSVIFPFTSTFAIKYFQHAHGLSLQDAGTMIGYVFFAAIVATPTFGFMVDRVGRRSLFMGLGTLLLFSVFPLLASTSISLWLSTALIGVAFSLVPAVMWPAVPYLVSPNRLGTAYGLMTMVQAFALTVFNLAIGALNDAWGAGAANPAGYVPMLSTFALLSLLGFVFTALLWRRESGPHGHALESVRPKRTA